VTELKTLGETAILQNNINLILNNIFISCPRRTQDHEIQPNKFKHPAAGHQLPDVTSDES
jgi:hypothetical protein